jgi:hypothetical protein
MAIMSYIHAFLVYRVHWLKAKARRDRWAEEATLVSHEMDWTIAFFHKQASKWRRRVSDGTVGLAPGYAGDDVNGYGPDGMVHPHDAHTEGTLPNSQNDRLSRGQRCYALRQEQMWLRFAERARDQFNKVKQADHSSV